MEVAGNNVGTHFKSCGSRGPSTVRNNPYAQFEYKRLHKIQAPVVALRRRCRYSFPLQVERAWSILKSCTSGRDADTLVTSRFC